MVDFHFGWVSVDVTLLAPGIARLEENPLFCLSVDDESELADLPEYKDVFEIEEKANGRYRFVRVKERANYRRIDFMIGSGFQAKALQPIFDAVLASGGYCERVFGGVVTILLPPNCEYDPGDDLRKALRLKWWQRATCRLLESRIWPVRIRFFFHSRLIGYRL